MTDREPLTDRQAEVLLFIAASIADGLPPTVREIGARFGIKSTNGVVDHLRCLERKGYIRRDALRSRAIWLVAPAARNGAIPGAPRRLRPESGGMEAGR